jgi:hypothetical protein
MNWTRRSRWLPTLLVLGAPFFLTTATQAFIISGTATNNQGGAPVAGVDVKLFTSGGTPIGIPPTLTDGAGFYSISPIPNGSYILGFEPPAATGLLAQNVSGVTVNNGDLTVDVQLDPGLILSGFVRDTLGQPIAGIDLNVYDRGSGDKLETPGDNTDVLGFYDVVVPDGRYILRWRTVDTTARWVAFELDDVEIQADTAIDVTLQSGWFVTGTVTGPGAVPLGNADLDFVDVLTSALIVTPTDNTDSFGRYKVVVPSGTFDVSADPVLPTTLLSGFEPGFVLSGDTTLDFQLVVGLTLSGRLTGPLGAGVAGADIDVRDAVTGVKLVTPGDNTDALGFYSISVPTGTFHLDYQPTVLSGLAPVRLSDVLLGVDTTINVQVFDGLVLSGIIQRGGAIPVAGVDLDVKVASTGATVPVVGDLTDALGAFSMVIPAVPVNVEVEPPLLLRLSSVLIAGLAPGGDTSITVVLDTGLLVSGFVTDSTGSVPVPGVDVMAIVSAGGDTVFTPGNHTDLLGAYQILVPPDTYDLYYRPDSLSGIPDTVILASVIVSKDTVINVSLAGAPPTVPHMVIDSSSMTFAAVENGATPGSRSFLLTNSGAGTLSWSASKSQSWLTVSPGSGSGNSQSIQVSVNTTALAPAAYFDTVVVASVNADNSPLVVPITYTVTFAGGSARGDVNNNGTVTSADIIYLVNYVFKGGPDPLPTVDNGDTNCSGTVTSADVIGLVNYVFKGAPEPFCP